jgi:hypothetical protein
MNVIRNNSAQRDDGIGIIEMVLACCKSGGSKIRPNGYNTGEETQRKMPSNSGRRDTRQINRKRN